MSPGRIPSRATRPDAPARTGHPDALAVCARVRLALAYHAAAGTTGRPVDVPELAQTMGANLNALRAVLAGHRGPPSSWGRARGRVTLERIAQALGCPVEALAPDAAPVAVIYGLQPPTAAPAVERMGSLDPRPDGPSLGEIERALNLSVQIGRP